MKSNLFCLEQVIITDITSWLNYVAKNNGFIFKIGNTTLNFIFFVNHIYNKKWLAVW